MIGKTRPEMRARKELLAQFCVENMELKVVCRYCGTVYSADEPCCPLCGGDHSMPLEEAEKAELTGLTEQPAEEEPAEEFEQTPEEQDEQPPEAEKKPKKKKKKKPQAEPEQPEKPEKSGKGFLLATVLFLLMAVGVMTYFIGDLLGYWPGLEDKLKHEIVYPNTDATEQCEQLELSPNRIDFNELGQTRELKIAINADCGETVYCSSENESVATVSAEARTSTEADMKYVVFTINAASPGETSIVVSCGKKKAYCTVMCDFEMPTTTEEQPEALPSDYKPELNYSKDIILTGEGAQKQLEVINLVDGYTVNWSTNNPDVVTVDKTGLLTAVDEGTATIVAEVGGRTARINVTCDFSGDVEGTAHLEITDATVSVGESFMLYLYNDFGEHVEGASYKVIDPSVCSINDNEVVALSPGTTEIVITYNGVEYTCIVRVQY